jgi:hypothetical protein
LTGLFTHTSAKDHGDEDDAHKAWLQCHSLHLQTKTLVLTTFFLHRFGGSSFTLPKIPKIDY